VKTVITLTWYRHF